MKIKKIIYNIFSITLWSLLTLFTIFPIYWMILVSTRTPVQLFGKPNLSPTFFEKIYWKNYTKPFVDGVFGDYLLNSIIIATSNAFIVTILAIMATYALSRYKIAGAETIFFWTMTKHCNKTLSRGGVYWKFPGPLWPLGANFPIHPDSRQCIAILFSKAGVHWKLPFKQSRYVDSL